MMKKTNAAVALALGLAAQLALAQSTPVGLWKTIDDDGKTEKSLVRITENGGVLHRQASRRSSMHPAKTGEVRQVRATSARTSPCLA